MDEPSHRGRIKATGSVDKRPERLTFVKNVMDGVPHIQFCSSGDVSELNKCGLITRSTRNGLLRSKRTPLPKESAVQKGGLIGNAPSTLSERTDSITGMNEITENDTYPLPLQAEIIALLRGFALLPTIDAVGWFHQFLVRRTDRFKFTIVTHGGQEESAVALMGYKGSPTYI